MLAFVRQIFSRLAGPYYTSEYELISKLSPPAKEAAAWASVNESYIPAGLTFDENGMPSDEACKDYSMKYPDSSSLYDPPQKLGESKRVKFMHLPKTGGTSVERFFPVYVDPKPGFSLQGNHCNATYAKYHLVKGPGFVSSCNFHLKHVPPRYFRPDYYEGQIVFCIVRDPVDKVLSSFKMDHKSKPEKLNGDGATEFFRTKIKSYMKLPDDRTWPQYEYIWNENGTRTCHHVFRFEDGVAKAANTIIDLYEDPPMKRNAPPRMNDSVHHVSHHYANANSLTVKDVGHEEVVAMRKMFWRDYCLLGYYRNNPWV